MSSFFEQANPTDAAKAVRLNSIGSWGFGPAKPGLVLIDSSAPLRFPFDCAQGFGLFRMTIS